MVALPGSKMGIRSLISQKSSEFLQGVFGAPARDTAWADGLRGIAAIGVVWSHIVLTFFRYLIPPVSGGPGGEPLLFQRPIFRLIVQGNAWVAIFFILMGFVNPLKALKQRANNDIEGALVSLSKSGIARITRLVLPAAAITVIAWFCCQLHMFQVARASGAYWITINSPDPSSGFDEAITDLFRSLRDTWTLGYNVYDQPQWPLRDLLKGSMWVLLLLVITIHATPKFRIMTYTGFWIFCQIKKDGLIGHNIIPGMILAELQGMGCTPFTSRMANLVTTATAFLGLYLMSFPNEFHDWTPWSRNLLWLGTMIYPIGGDLPRFWSGLGAQILCFSIFYNQYLRNFFSLPVFTWLGSISFSLYLIHGTMMRTILAWMTYLPQYWHRDEFNTEELPMPSAFILMLTLPAFFVMTTGAAQLWTVKVEPYFGTATTALQKFSAKLGASSSTPSGSSAGRADASPLMRQRSSSPNLVRYD